MEVNYYLATFGSFSYKEGAEVLSYIYFKASSHEDAAEKMQRRLTLGEMLISISLQDPPESVSDLPF